MANLLAHPRYQVPRSYRVQVAGLPKPDTIRELKKGMHFSHGFFKVKGVKRLKTQGKSAFLEIELTEGRNREIRRLFARVGHKVINLTRVEFGPLKLGRLVSGKSRPLRAVEMKALRDFVATGGSLYDRTDEQKTGSKKKGTKKRGGQKKTASGSAGPKPASKPKKGRAKPAAKTTKKKNSKAGKKKSNRKTVAKKKQTGNKKPATTTKKKQRRKIML